MPDDCGNQPTTIAMLAKMLEYTLTSGKNTSQKIEAKPTFKLTKVKIAPKTPPRIPRIATGMKTRMCKATPWSI